MEKFFGGKIKILFIIFAAFLGVIITPSSANAASLIPFSKKDCEALGTTWKNGGCYVWRKSALSNNLTEVYVSTGSDLINISGGFYTLSGDGATPSVCAEGFKRGKNSDGWEGCVVSDKSKTGFPSSSAKRLWTKSGCEDKGGKWLVSGGCFWYIKNNGVFYAGNQTGKIIEDTSNVHYSTTNNDIPDKFYSEKCPSTHKKKEERKDGKKVDVCINNLALIDNPDGDDDGDGIPNKDDPDYQGTTEQSGENETSCAIDNLGWIICPSTNFLAEVVTGVYKTIADNFLEIQSNVLFGEDAKYMGGNSVKGAWDSFRNIANVLFVVAFTIVIISQITNVGISNYGIKKLLPRLLIFAILINISYYISVIFVDLSNILGKSLFNLMAGAEWVGMADAGGKTRLSDTVLLGLAGSGIAATLFGGVAILSLVTAVIGILIMWLVLVVRQSVVILLVALSPIAFASAILPNTDSIMKRWMKMMKSMLVIYPVASVLMGGLVFASNILIGTTEENPLMQVVYMTLPIAGFGAVGSLVKGALAVIDNLTGMNFSGKLGALQQGANKAAQNSETLTKADAAMSGGLRRMYNKGVDAYSKTRLGKSRFTPNLRRARGQSVGMQKKLSAIAKEEAEIDAGLAQYQAQSILNNNKLTTNDSKKSKMLEDLSRTLEGGDDREIGVAMKAAQNLGMNMHEIMHGFEDSNGNRVGGVLDAMDNLRGKDEKMHRKVSGIINGNSSIASAIKNESPSAAEFFKRNAQAEASAQVSYSSVASDMKTWGNVNGQTMADFRDDERKALIGAMGNMSGADRANFASIAQATLDDTSTRLSPNQIKSLQEIVNAAGGSVGGQVQPSASSTQQAASQNAQPSQSGSSGQNVSVQVGYSQGWSNSSGASQTTTSQSAPTQQQQGGSATTTPPSQQTAPQNPQPTVMNNYYSASSAPKSNLRKFGPQRRK